MLATSSPIMATSGTTEPSHRYVPETRFLRGRRLADGNSPAQREREREPSTVMPRLTGRACSSYQRLWEEWPRLSDIPFSL